MLLFEEAMLVVVFGYVVGHTLSLVFMQGPARNGNGHLVAIGGSATYPEAFAVVQNRPNIYLGALAQAPCIACAGDDAISRDGDGPFSIFFGAPVCSFAASVLRAGTGLGAWL